ncbi:alpha-amylase family glycosyl hydrolase [Oleiagrimonas sp. C23AA]|uniref:alpha-amylase family glycosyl hydrolase n=1 Tax=Oleiagrimonas sp. C23AA TaxID=2719047 RepID=UPI00142421EB|nr:alpha-amylase family glycosyl hydrolase [Oleiagrimonas sp. C23AA]NII09283.1 DUF3459 domain-containing protein [Oleiagrimonas sp. C23AA]
MKPESLPWWRQAPVNRRAFAWEQQQQCDALGEWWHGAAIYQLMVRSYLDSDGDGRGDLRGLIHRLDYLGSIGIDAIWLTPIYPSGGHDLGYDVIDMCDVSPDVGTLDDLEILIHMAHQRGLRVMLDMVWNHTSDQHPWFLESRASRNNPKADWYVWADPAEYGGPPNNWLSVFDGASGWRWCEERGQYYWANFFASQPDLNWHNEDVRAEILKQARFWLDRGVDGLRLDAVNFYAHDPELRDNPPRGQDDPPPDGINPRHPAAQQKLTHSFNRPETLEYLRPIRELANEYPAVALLGEITLCEDSIATAAKFTHGEHRLHLAYHDGLLFDERMTAQRICKVVSRTLELFGECGSCWIVGNHDFGRLASRWGGDEKPYPKRFHRTVAALLLSLPGASCLWQGDELGLPQARIPEDIPYDRVIDPAIHAKFGNVRDGSRTPMPWNHEKPHCGFTSAPESWLPVPESHRELSVSRQQVKPDSMLNGWRTLLHWRVAQPAMRAGRSDLMDVPEPWLAIVRSYAEQSLLCLFNLSEEAAEIDLCEQLEHLRLIEGLGFEYEQIGEHAVRVPAWGSLIAEISREGSATRATSQRATPAANAPWEAPPKKG